MARLDGRQALVTGGGSGIGLAVARRLAAEGAAVTILGRDRAKLEAAATALGTPWVQADVTDAAGLAAALAGLARCDILVANAGTAESAPFRRADAAHWRRLLEVNLMGTVHAIQAVLPGMVERGSGRIVAVASTAALKGYPYVSAYCAAKHAVLGLVRALALETARSGVTVNAVCPGFTETALLERSLARIAAATGRDGAAAREELLRGNPQGRFVRPEEVADAVAWLAGAEAAAVTGQAIAVAGGEVP